MATKVKISKESLVKAEELLTFYGYSGLEELVEDLINKEYEKIKSGSDDKDELASKLSGLGYIS